MQFRVLGPLEVVEGGHRYSLGGPKQRAVLALLLARAGHPVAVGTLIDSLYGDGAPDRAHRSIHTFVSNLRSELGEVIERDGEGYAFVVDTQAIDAMRFENAVDQAELIEHPAESSAVLREALALWRGLPFADVDVYDGLAAESTRLNELRLVALSRRIDADLAEGRHAALIGELESLTVEYPLRETFWAQQMLALYRSGRQAEALRAFNKARAQLVEETGLDPSPELQNLERRILDHDDSLQIQARPTICSAAILAADVADLTRLFTVSPAERDALVERQTKALENAVDQHHGTLFAHRGSAVYASFDSVAHAAGAAAEVQRKLYHQDAHMRMAVAFGDVEMRSATDVHGPPVSRAAALVAAAHPGQLLLGSNAHQDLIEAGGAGWLVRSLGTHTFRGMPDPLPVHQLVIDGLPETYPALRMHELPPPLPGIDAGLPGYELREEVGSGIFGVVHRAYQPTVGREVAIKIIRPEFANHPEFVRRFEIEAQLVARLEHPHIVPLHDYWRDPAGAFLVMRWLRGRSLADRLTKGSLELHEVHTLLDQIVPALDHAHRHGVVHRDLKPSNVMFDGDGNAYLTDFGIAKRVDDVRSASLAEDIKALAHLVARCLESTTVSDRVARMLDEAEDGRFDTLASFLDAWRTATGQTGVGEEVVGFTPARNPYKGLAAFGELDASDFYGRDAEIRQLVDAIGRQRLVAVVGPSGVGKSSVVRAGLLPALRAGAVSGSAEWLVTHFMPGAYPYHELAAALNRVAIEDAYNLEDELRRDPHELTRYVKRGLPPSGGVLIVIDQFEELFTLVDDEHERAAFIDLLRTAVSDEASNIRIVLTLRADYFDRPLRYGAFGDMLRDSTVPLAAPSNTGLREIVERPAASVGVRFEPELVGRIVEAVKDQPGALPLLEFSLTELFAARQTDLLQIEAYEDSGGVVGALGRRAETIFLSLDEAGRRAAADVFMRMVNVADTGSDTRRRVRLRELEQLGIEPAVITAVLEAFGQYRLLTFDRDPVTRGPSVELAHEAIISEWSRLAEWITGRREDLLLHSRLASALADWEAAGESDEYLLTAGRLDQHEAWTADTDLSLTERELAYLRFSRESIEQRRSQSRRVRRRVMAGLAAAAIIAGSLGAVAFVQRGAAQRAADTAVARELAAESIAQLSVDPERSVLLALQAIATGRSASVDTLELETALRRAIAEHRILDRRDGGVFVDVSDDGSLLATGHLDGAARVVDMATGEESVSLSRPDLFASRGVFSPSGNELGLIYGGDRATEVWVWDRATAEMRQLEDPGSFARSQPLLSFDDSGELIAAALHGTVYVWSVASGGIVRSITGPEVRASDADSGSAVLAEVVFIPGSSDVLITDVVNTALYRYDATTGEPVGEPIDVAIEPLTPAFSDDGSIVVLASSNDQAAAAYDLNSGAELWRTTLDRALGVEWLSTGDRVAVGSDIGRVAILDAATGDSVDVLSGGHIASVWEIAAVPGSEILYTSGASDGATLAWTVGRGPVAEIRRFDGRAEQLRVALYAPYPDQAFVSDNADNSARIFDIDSGAVVLELKDAVVNVTGGFETVPMGDGSFVGYLGNDGTAAVIDSVSGEVLLEAPEGWMYRDASYDAEWVLTMPIPGSGVPGNATVVDIASGDVMATLDTESLFSPWFSYDAEWILDWNDPFAVYSVDTGELVVTPTVQTLRTVPNSDLVSMVDYDGTLWSARLDDILEGVPIERAAQWSAFATQGRVVMTGHVASPDGKYVAVMARNDEPAYVFESQTGVPVASLDPQLTNGVPTIAFHPDTPHVTLASAGGILLTYTLDIDELVDIARDRVTRALTDAECQTFLRTDTCPVEPGG